MMNTILVITGPTATGKTETAFYLAKKFNGECISADSRHVYSGMDIVTGKDLYGWKKDTSTGVRVESGDRVYVLHPYRKKSVSVWLYDVVPPNEVFSVKAYTDCARAVYSDIAGRHKLPILVGGTGLYISSFFVSAPSCVVPPDWEFRKKAALLETEELARILISLSQDAYRQMNVSDKRNPRRLIRRIEILRAMGNIPKMKSGENNEPLYDSLWIGLTAKNSSLYKRIDQRVDARIESGALAEIDSLYALYSPDCPSLSAIGYKHFIYKQSRVLHSQSYMDAVRSWKNAEHAYARRQKTWAKKNPHIYWFDIDDASYLKKVEATVSRWYTKHSYAGEN